MKQFSQFREKMVDQSAVLVESLDTAVDFYMTDDTKMPISIYGAYEIDGTQYGVSLEQSNFNKVYILKVYRIVNTKRRFWAFLKPTHIRPVIATVLKFVESCIPFLHSKMDGMIIEIPGKMKPDRLNRLLEFIVKKSYSKSFRSVKVMSDNKEQAYHFMFIVRKVVSPKSLFSSKSFSKYSFDDVKINELPVAAAQDIQTKMKIQKISVTTAPSKKFSFKGMVVKDTALDAHANAAKIINAEPKLAQVEPEHAGKPIDDVLKSLETKSAPKIVAQQVAKPEPEAPKPVEPKPLTMSAMVYLLIAAMPKMAGQIKQSGYIESKFDQGTFIYVLKKTIGTNLEALYYYYKHVGFLDESDHLTPLGIQFTKLTLSKIDDLFKKYPSYETNKISVLKSINAWTEYFEKMDAIKKKTKSTFTPTFKTSNNKQSIEVIVKSASGNEVKSSVVVHKPLKSLIDTSIDFSALKSELPGEGEFVLTYGYYGTEVNEDTTAKKYAINKAGYGLNGNLINKGVKLKSFNVAKKYTSNGSSYYNSAMRRVFSNYVAFDKDISVFNYDDSLQKAEIMQKAFDQVEPFPYDMWLYRGASLGITPETELYPGKLYVDPAFLSCAIHSTNTHGMGNIKHRIFVPKGSRVLPMLNESHHPNENEIILPASSVLKIIKYDKIVNDHDDLSYIVTSIYTGHVGDSMFKKYNDKFNKKETLVMAAESKKPITTKEPKYDPNKKFGGPVNAQFSKKIGSMIKKGEVIVKK